MVNLPVLVLNQNYRPLNICRVRRAVVLLLYGKAELLENGLGVIHSSEDTFPVPSVIRLAYLVKRPYPQRKLTKLEIFNRDHYTCQYCGRETKELTLDHVIPRRRNGEHSWENIVAACMHCNRRKAGRSPSEAGMTLLHQPRQPKDNNFYIPYDFLQSHTEWQKYLH